MQFRTIPITYIKLLRRALYLVAGFFLSWVLLKLNPYISWFTDFIGLSFAKSGLLALAVENFGNGAMEILVLTVPAMIQAGLIGTLAGLTIGFFIRNPVNLRLLLLGCVLAVCFFTLWPAIHFLLHYEAVVHSLPLLSLSYNTKTGGMYAISKAASMGQEMLRANFCMLAFLLVLAYAGRSIYSRLVRRRQANVTER